MESDHEVEQAISLKEAAKRLGLSYQTVWERRHQIAFRLAGCRVWRVWPSKLIELTQSSPKVSYQVQLAEDKGSQALRTVAKSMLPVTRSQLEAEKELDALLARHSTKNKRAG